MIVTSILLSSMLAVQGASIDSARPQRSFRFVYTAAVPEVPAGTKQVRLWIPTPLDTPDQTISKITLTAKAGGDDSIHSATVTGSTPELLKDSAKDGIEIMLRDVQGGFGRSACIQTQGKPVEVELSFDVTRYETTGGGAATEDELAALKQPNRLIPLNGKVAAVAASMKLPSEPMEIARALYDHTLERMKYDKPDGQAWGRGDAEWACDAKYGNCTDFHSYFMGLVRTKGLAARFEMGFHIVGGDEKEAKVGGYHCWAYVWVEGRGWMPVDISEADKNPARTDFYFGTLDADRVTMTGGRDLTLHPTPAEGALNFFVYPVAEADGKKLDNVSKGFKRINL